MSDTSASTIKLKRCEACREKLPTTELYRVRSMDMCQGCGNREIENWNRLVRESDATPSLQVRP